MSNYYHGAKASKQATSVSTPVVADSSIHLIVGTAPVHTVGGKINEPVYASNYAEAVAAMGYSDEWDKYDICEEIYSSFKLMDLLLWLMSLTLQSTLKEQKQ